MGKRSDEMTKTRTFRVNIYEDFCKGCKLCVAHCPKDCLALTTDRINAKGVQFSQCVRPEDCIGCRACVTVCPDACIELFEVIDEDNDG